MIPPTSCLWKAPASAQKKKPTKAKSPAFYQCIVREVKRLIALSCIDIYLPTCTEAAPPVTRHGALQKDGDTSLRKPACCNLAPRRASSCCSCCLLRLASSYVADRTVRAQARAPTQQSACRERKPTDETHRRASQRNANSDRSNGRDYDYETLGRSDDLV